MVSTGRHRYAPPPVSPTALDNPRRVPMGVIRWLNRIDPDVWARACDALVAARPETPDDAQKFLRQFNREASEFLLQSFEDVEEEPRLRPSLRNSLLEEATKESSWELDKSLSHGLEQVPRWIPTLAPLRKIIDFKGIDRDVPKECAPDDGSGLFGCISSAGLSDCVAAVGDFGSIQDLISRLREAKPGVVASFLGQHRQIASLSSRLEDDYFATHWANLRAAILETSSRGHYLGLGMST